jgi:dTDP-glucose 4,6-dehydratase
VEIDEPVDFVYHLAEPASPIDYLRLPLHTLKVGSYGTHHMLGLAKFKRARFLLASTSEVYGDPSPPQPETTGATSTRSARAASTTRPSATPRR